jgi:D-serine dehydratase
VGGAPGGITFGLKQVWGDSVHCFFGEPVAAPSMLLGLATRRYEQASVYDIGLLLDTEADGLAVARPSRLVSRMMERLISGCYTVSDDQLYRNLADLKDTEEMRIEPSAAAGVAGPLRLLGSAAGEAYLRDRGLSETVMEHATHLIWTTGGALVPDEEYARFYERGRLAAQRR